MGANEGICETGLCLLFTFLEQIAKALLHFDQDRLLGGVHPRIPNEMRHPQGRGLGPRGDLLQKPTIARGDGLNDAPGQRVLFRVGFARGVLPFSLIDQLSEEDVALVADGGCASAGRIAGKYIETSKQF